MEFNIGKPSDKQRQFLLARKKYVIFGGARGGGKSWSVRAKSIALCLKHPGIVCTIVRKTYPELYSNHIKYLRRQLLCGTNRALAKYNDGKKEITFGNGSSIVFKYCDTDKDLSRFQGLETDVLFLDEATQMSEYQIKTICACVRGNNSFPKRIYMTCNPGGQGHGYIKRIAIDRQYVDGENPEDFEFIQSLVTDNTALMRSNPDYIRQLEALPPKIREAWLHGRWDVFEGAFFEQFRQAPDMAKVAELGYTEEYAKRKGIYTHVIDAFDVSQVPDTWRFYRSYDWGFGKPFSVGWWVLSPEGVLVRILELYGCTKTPNEGIRWTNKQQAREIKRIESEHPWLKGRRIFGVADPSIWDGSHDADGISCAETFEHEGIYFEKGNNSRIQGWMQVQERMRFDEGGRALIYFFPNCEAAIRTIPLMMHDEHRCEDLDTSLEDHCLAGDTMVLTDEGYKTIESLVGTEGKVKSHDGLYHSYHDVRLTRKGADVYRLTLEDGTQVICTDDHRFMMSDGEWVRLKNLAAGNELLTIGCGASEKVKSIEYIGKQDVYNMEVEDTHSFVIQGGIVSHNCVDEIRYMCMKHLIPIKAAETPVIHEYDPLNQFTSTTPERVYKARRV